MLTQSEIRDAYVSTLTDWYNAKSLVEASSFMLMLDHYSQAMIRLAKPNPGISELSAVGSRYNTWLKVDVNRWQKTWYDGAPLYPRVEATDEEINDLVNFHVIKGQYVR